MNVENEEIMRRKNDKPDWWTEIPGVPETPDDPDGCGRLKKYFFPLRRWASGPLR